MDKRGDRYDAFPYPERNPADEGLRLISGSPSNLAELDHYLFAGRRDWSQPMRVLVAGGGTGDGLVMLAQQLTDTGVPHEVVYLDRSAASRDIARARAAARGLTSIDFRIGDLLTAEGLGLFDYIDCCGVLHHLQDPAAGARRLAGLLEPTGGIGGLVYAPLGRTGVYPLQSAFRTLLGEMPYAAQVAEARRILTGLPKSNWLLRNPFVTDHKVSDAGFFDLLLHTTDRPFWADELIGLLGDAGLRTEALIQPIKYDPLRHLPPGSAAARMAAAFDYPARCRLAEELTGTIKTHIFYARHADAPALPPLALADPDNVLRLASLEPAALANQINRGAEIKVTVSGLDYTQRMHRRTAVLLRHADRRRSLGEMLAAAGMTGLEPGVERDLRFLIDVNQLNVTRLGLQLVAEPR